MIEGANSSMVDFEEQNLGKDTKDELKQVSSIIDSLEERRQNVLNGGTNCIPLPFQRFRQEIPGIEQGQYVLVTANAKVGKTNYADFTYMFHVLDYVFAHPDRCSCHIIYFSLEEAVSKVIERYMSYLLYKLDGIRIAPVDLRSTSSDAVLPQEILDLLKSDVYMERLKFFEQCVTFETENTNPTGIFRVCENYAKSVGVYKSHKQQSNGVSGKTIEIFDSYKQNDPNHYKIMIVDHIGLVDKEQGFRTKDAVDKMSEYCVKYLRNRYNYTCVIIQQQASDAEGLEAIKQKKMVPTASTLGDTKYTARDADIVLGLFDPSRFGLPAWLGYKIQDENNLGLRNYGRFLYVINNRNGEMGGICPLFFDGAVCYFEELPRVDDINAITSYYNKIKQLKSYRQTQKVKQLSVLQFNLVRHGKDNSTNRKKQTSKLQSTFATLIRKAKKWKKHCYRKSRR